MMALAKDIEGGKAVPAALTRSEKKLIHMARALIMNPEMLIVHTPGMYFEAEQRLNMVRLLEQANHVQALLGFEVHARGVDDEHLRVHDECARHVNELLFGPSERRWNRFAAFYVLCKRHH